MNSKHSISSCIVSLLLAMIMLLTVFPAAAESLATPTDLASIEETETLQEAQTDPESEEDETDPNTENPADSHIRRADFLYRLLALEVVVPLLKPGGEERGRLHVEVEHVYRERHREKAEGDQQQIQREFQ